MPGTWEYREPAEGDGHPQTEATRWQGEQYRQDEHLGRLNGPQVDAPRHQPLPGFEQTGQLQATSPQYVPPRQVSWVSAHKGLTAVYSLCAAAVIGAGVFALATSGPGSPGTPPGAPDAAGISTSSPPSHQQPGAAAAAQPAAGSTVTGTAKTVRAGAKVKAVPAPDAAPSAPKARSTGAPVVTSSTPVVITTTAHTTPIEPTSPPPSPPPVTPTPAATCMVTGDVPEVQGTAIGTVAGTATESFDVSEYGTGGAALAQIVISVPAPTTAGAVVTGEGPANTSLVSCVVTGVEESGN
jgi:hypothetical protein